MLSIDEFTELADEIAEKIPEALTRELNGGMLVVSQECRDPGDPEIYILGEYVVDDPGAGMGRYIVLYYGSFAAVLEDEPPASWEEELWETLKHELRHHLESLGGIDDLGLEDLRQMEEWRRQRFLSENG